MYSLLIGGCGVVNLQTSPKIIAKIKRFSIKEKFLSIILHFIVCKDGFYPHKLLLTALKLSYGLQQIDSHRFDDTIKSLAANATMRQRTSPYAFYTLLKRNCQPYMHTT